MHSKIYCKTQKWKKIEDSWNSKILSIFTTSIRKKLIKVIKAVKNFSI